MNATTNHKIRATVTLPPGRYVVGDPCYAIPDTKWMEWLEDADYLIQDRRHVLHAHVFGYPCVGVSTMYGDGTYFDQKGNEFPVDAGLIGLVDVRCSTVARLKDPGVVIYEFVLPVECHYGEDGTIHLGHFEIFTGDAEDECGTCAEPESACVCGDEYEDDDDDQYVDDPELDYEYDPGREEWMA